MSKKPTNAAILLRAAELIEEGEYNFSCVAIGAAGRQLGAGDKKRAKLRNWYARTFDFLGSVVQDRVEGDQWTKGYDEECKQLRLWLLAMAAAVKSYRR